MDKMNDIELADYLHLTPDQAAIVVPKLTLEKRAVYNRMREVEIEAALWVDGLGPRPKSALIDTVRSVRHRMRRYMRGLSR
jgi:hypothetical protein